MSMDFIELSEKTYLFAKTYTTNSGAEISRYLVHKNERVVRTMHPEAVNPNTIAFIANIIVARDFGLL